MDVPIAFPRKFAICLIGRTIGKILIINKPKKLCFSEKNHSKLQFNDEWYFLLWATCAKKDNKKSNNWVAFVWIQKSAPRKSHFLIDFIRSHLCALLDSGIGKRHRSQTWRYQGATVETESNFNSFIMTSKLSELSELGKRAIERRKKTS